jgi:hypothetical protein
MQGIAYLLLSLLGRYVWLLVALTLLSRTSSSSAQGTANRMSAPMLDDLEPFVDAQDSLAAAAGRGVAREAASSRAGGGSSDSSSIGLGAYLGCFNASSGWQAGAENATKVRLCLISHEPCYFGLPQSPHTQASKVAHAT